MNPKDLNAIREKLPLSASTIAVNSPDNKGAHPVIQEQKEVRERPRVHGQENPPVDGQRDQQYRVTITFHISDRRRRDIDGGTSTLLDCIVAARRQLDGNTGSRTTRKSLPKGRRTCCDIHRANIPVNFKETTFTPRIGLPPCP